VPGMMRKIARPSGTIEPILAEKPFGNIQNQVEHHRRRTFQEEYLAFLKRHERSTHSTSCRLLVAGLRFDDKLSLELTMPSTVPRIGPSAPEVPGHPVDQDPTSCSGWPSGDAARLPLVCRTAEGISSSPLWGAYLALAPPSTAKAIPVIHSASRETRNSTHWATSSGVPKRGQGVSCPSERNDLLVLTILRGEFSPADG
jgi:hypothetical protein